MAEFDLLIYSLQAVTCSIGRGISLNKKRRKKQKRFYNVQSKKGRTAEASPPESSAVFESQDLVEPAAQPQQSPRETPSNPPSTSLLDDYFQHQETMQVEAKTVAALKEKYTAPSKKKQMFDLMTGKGLYKKFPNKDFRNFNSWLQSPSGGQLKCPDEIISEISRYVFVILIIF